MVGVVWDRSKNFEKNVVHFPLGNVVVQEILDYMKKYE